MVYTFKPNPQTIDYVIYQDGTLNIARNVNSHRVIASGTNAQTVIQAALDLGGTIHIKEGTYNTVTDALRPIEQTILQGDGAKTILRCGDSVQENIIVCNSVDDVIIRNLNFDGNQAGNVFGGDTGKQCCIYTTGANRIWVMNNILHDSLSHGTLFNTNSTQCRFINNYCYNGARSAVTFHDGSNFGVATHNYILDYNVTGYPGLHSHNNCYYLIFSNNTVNNANLGVQLTDSSEAVISNNTFYECNDGVELGTTAKPVNRIYVMNNYFSVCNSYGIDAFLGTGNVIGYNRFYCNTPAARLGIRARTGFNDATIIGNSFNGWFVGLQMDAGCTSPTVMLNRFLNNTTNVTNNATTPRFWGNMGYVTEAWGATANVADGGNIAHGLSITPTTVIAQPSISGEMVSVTAIGAANFTVAIKTHAGAAGTQQTIYWRAYL
mgnify:CR=1 FL=1